MLARQSFPFFFRIRPVSSLSDLLIPGATTVDLIVNVVLTLSFIIPIAKSRFPKARKLAQRSAAAAVISLATSFVNIIILSIMHGKQLSFVCLGACGLDVTINAAMLFLVSPPYAFLIHSADAIEDR